ncbi:hypothetical protein EDB81DRAFT_924351 [Dactylonectria macrodidyma]|uniref:Uncharacterized protein n=1 Tax=Dactylonectria macrodidyma TaxID=307937 RepID=A0A9P9JD46_9HYPO|nr:hypothetical protein EDB81DRAFT_924351 [Dactylonectria macrodidyma]
MAQNLKAGLYATFLLGMHHYDGDSHRSLHLADLKKDYVISVRTIASWTTLEANLGLLIACLPSLRPYFGRNGTKESVNKSSTSQQSSGEPKAGFALISTCSNVRNTSHLPIRHIMRYESDVELARGMSREGSSHNATIEDTPRRSEGNECTTL